MAGFTLFDIRRRRVLVAAAAPDGSMEVITSPGVFVEVQRSRAIAGRIAPDRSEQLDRGNLQHVPFNVARNIHTEVILPIRSLEL